jgi:hypothetical protein
VRGLTARRLGTATSGFPHLLVITVAIACAKSI